MVNTTWANLLVEADNPTESFWTDAEHADYDAALQDAHDARNAGMWPSEFIPLFDYADELAERFDARHEDQRERHEHRQTVLGDFEKVAQWDAEGSPPIIETHYADDYGKLYLPAAGPSADLIFEWIATTSNAVTGKHTPIAGMRYVSFRKGDFRTRLETALGVIYPEFRRISTHWDMCNVACREAYDIECECRCDNRHHQNMDYSGYRVVPYSHEVLVREHADNNGIYVDDDIVQGSGEVQEVQDQLVQEFISNRGTSDDHHWAYISFEEEQTRLHREPVISEIERVIAARKKLVGDRRAAR